MNTNDASTRFAARRLLVGFAGAWLGLGAAIGHAADESPALQVRTQVVQYGDLNLTNPQAVQRLYQRIVAAAGEVCDSGGDHRSLQAFRQERSCQTRAIARAVAAVGSPELSALHSAKTGRPMIEIAHR